MIKEEKLKPVMGGTEVIPTANKFSKAEYRSIIREMIDIVEKNEDFERRNNLVRNETLR